MRCLPLLFIALLHAAPGQAQTTLDRLFLTPAERLDLDRVRDNGSQSSDPFPERITLDGYVRNSRGKATAWFNQERTGEADVPGQLQHDRRGQPVRVPVQRDGRRAALKVGQTWEVATDTIREVYQAAPSVPGGSR